MISNSTSTTQYTTNYLNQHTATVNPTESFTYDFDGNLTQDGTYKYTWDAENRLTVVEPKASPPPANSKKLMFAYDYMGRRLQKQVFNRNGSTSNWDLFRDLRFVYDSRNVLLELDGFNNNAVLRKYTWGTDLSGSLHGAGGIGGLLAMQDVLGASNYAYLYDANGNVGQVIDRATDLIYKAYEYSPYGEQFGGPGGGSGSDRNPFRFSTKYIDEELADGHADDLYYYGERYYLPRLGRWANRDPLGEVGDLNLYRANGNDPPNKYDATGLFWYTWHRDFTAQAYDRSGVVFADPTYLTKVIDANLWTDNDYYTVPALHAQSQEFVPTLQGFLRHLHQTHCSCTGRDNREFVLTIMGRTLHMIQDFYSHTDWIHGTDMDRAYEANGDGALLGRLWTHPPYYPRTFSLERIDNGDGSELYNVIMYQGGYFPWSWDDHNKYALDLNRQDKFRTREPPYGLGQFAWHAGADTTVRATEEAFVYIRAIVSDSCRARLFR